MQFAPDGRLFICQQSGKLRVVQNGTLLATPFLTVPVNDAGERGLLGVAFDPDFETNNFVYVYYTATSPNIHNRLSRFTANGNVAVPGSEVVLLNLNALSGATNHNGGAIHFGNDGKLYIAVGDNANSANSQTLGNLLGKILRINRDGSIPANNPFFGTASGVNRAIWALGLRNPFTMAFERSTGRLFINDVGEVSWEEINEGVAGANYGWPTVEGPSSNPDPDFDYPFHCLQAQWRRAHRLRDHRWRVLRVSRAYVPDRLSRGLFLRRLLLRVDPPHRSGQRSRFRHLLRKRHFESGRPEGRPRRSAVLPRPRERGRRSHQLCRCRAAVDHAAARRAVRSRSDSRRPSPSAPPAAHR